jgi:hypothetical protein
MTTEQEEWSDYAQALRQIAGARVEAQQAQDRLTANRSRAEATAMTEADAVADRGRRLEQRLTALTERAAAELQQAGVSPEGRRVAISPPKVRGTADIEAAAARLTEQLGDAVEQLEQLRGRARADRERRRRRTVNVALVVMAFVAVWLARGSYVDGLAAAGVVLLTLLVTPRLSGSIRVAWAAAVVVVIAMATGLPWWLAILVPAVVAGTSIVVPNKRN